MRDAYETRLKLDNSSCFGRYGAPGEHGGTRMFRRRQRGVCGLRRKRYNGEIFALLHRRRNGKILKPLREWEIRGLFSADGL